MTKNNKTQINHETLRNKKKRYLTQNNTKRYLKYEIQLIMKRYYKYER